MKASILLLALAGAPQLLLPPWPLSPDGEEVAVRGGASLAAEGAIAEPLAAEGARVEPLAPGLFRVTPAPGAAAVRLTAGSASAEARVEPPPARIELGVRPEAPVKGRDASVEVELVVPGAVDAEGPPLELVASTGRVREVVALGAGRFRAVYEPAAARHPEVVVLLALAPRCPRCPTPRAVGFAILPLAAAIDLPGRSEPGARTTLTLGGKTFGPAVADARGRFSVPVVVPPGARRASALSVDSIGNRRRTELDLGLPEVDHLGCAAWPRQLPADGRAEAAIWCVASSAAGVPAPEAAIELAASAGAIGPAAPQGGGLTRATFRAPRGGGGGEAVITARHAQGGPASVDRIAIALATGAPAEVTVTLARDPVPLGATVAAEVLVRDGRGDVLGRAAAPAGAAEGFVDPARFVARTTAGDLVQRAPVVFGLAPGEEVATLSLRREREGWLAEARTLDARPARGVPLRFGSGAVATTDARGEARTEARGDRETVAAANGARAAGWAGVAPPAAPFELARTVEVALRPAAPVDVTARVEGGAVRWRVTDQAGNALPGRAVTLRGGGVELSKAERDGDGGRAVVRSGHGPVAVVDEATGVAAIVEVP